MRASALIFALSALALAGCPAPPAESETNLSPDAGASAEPVSEAADGGVEDAGYAADAGDAGVDLGAPLPSYAEEPFPAKRTGLPAWDEWASAPRVAIDRTSPPTLIATHERGTSVCTARRIREWVRVHCPPLRGGTLLLGGNRDGLSMRFDKEGGVELVIPVRPGDRREIEVLGTETISFKAFSAERPALTFVISEHWVAGEDRPTIVAE